MKKNYFFVLFAALFCMAMPTAAQVTSMSDLFGKYKFTATITTTDAGQEHAALWSDDCEVIITKGTNGAAGTVKGLLGNGADQTIADIYLTDNRFDVINPNPNYGLLSSNPYIGVADMSLENLQLYTMEYHYNPETKEITIPDFSICKFSWVNGGDMVGEVLAEVTNVKMVLLEAEKVEIPEIEGEWSFKPYSLGYVENDTTFVYEFKMNLTAKDDTKQLYDATFSFEGFEDFTLEATFNGVDLVIPFNNQYLDAEQKIRLGVKATTQEMTLIKEGQLSFTYSSPTMMWQNDYVVIRKDVITTEEVEGEVVEKESAEKLQQITYGWIEREDPNAYDWSGTYTVNANRVVDYDPNDTIAYSKEFEMVVEKSMGSFYVTKLLGYDTSIELVANKDGKSATMNIGGGYYGFTILKSLGEVDGDYAYLALTDINNQSTSLDVTLNEDGSLSISDFSVSYFLWMADTYKGLVLMSGVSATKAVVEAPKFEWVGEYTLTAKIKGTDETVSFDVEIQKNAYDGSYLITKFDGDAVYNLNYGGIALVIADDNKVATFDGGKYVGGTYPKYITINSADATTATIELAVNADGNITMDDFLYKEMDYETLETTDLATYSNVVLTKKATTESSIEIMSVNPADGASVESVSYIQLIFNEDVTVTMPEGGIEVKNTTTNEVFATSLYENEYMDKNMVMLQFAKDASLTPGAYTYTIPAGMVKSVGGEEFAGQTFTFTVVEAFELVDFTVIGEEEWTAVQFTFTKAVSAIDLSKLTLWNLTYTDKFALKNEVTFSDDKKTVTVEFENAITATPGWYEWSAGAGAFTSEDGVENDYAYLGFEIVDYSPSFSLMDINGYLNDGDRRQQLGNVIEIMFNNVNEVELVEGKTVTVYLPGAGEVIGTASKVNSSILVTFDQEFTGEGEYIIEIPAGMFKMDGVENERRELTVELYTLQITPLEVASITNVVDENGHIVAIRVAYNQDVLLAYDEYYQTISSNISLMDDKGNAINLVENYNESLPWTTLEYVLGSRDEETWQIATTPLTEAGTYTLDLSQIVVRYGYNPDTWDYSADGYCEGTHTITVEATGIESAEAATENAVIYDLLGRRIEKITGAGLYIVNGKKVLVK